MIPPSQGNGGCTITMKVGSKIKVEVPYELIEGQSWFVQQGSIKFNGDDRPLMRGFLVENTYVGVIEETDNTEEVAVFYTQLRDGENRVWFFSATGETAICNVTRIPVHDHSSIMQGGPAYATYFSGNIESNTQQEQ
jgi:hypothetical protein